LKRQLTGENKYLQSVRNKISDLVGFCVTKDPTFAVAKSCYDLFFIALTAQALNQEKQPSLSNRHTDFLGLINQRLTSNFSLSAKEIMKRQASSSTIQDNGLVGMQRQNIHTLKTYDCPNTTN
jgi:hypothetical protein